MANINPGYRGLATIGTIGNVRFGDSGLTAKQQIDAPDLIMGDWDHDAFNYGKIEVSGNISGPVTETFVNGAGSGGLVQWACKRSGYCGSLDVNDVELYYYCSDTANLPNYRKFSGVLVNSLNFSCTAGDVAQFTLDLMGSSAGDWEHKDPSAIPHFTIPEKMITWDRVKLEVDPNITSPDNDPVGNAANWLAIPFQEFNFTVSNNLTAQYSLSQSNLFPFEIVPGLRTINGSFTVYNIPGDTTATPNKSIDGALAFANYNAQDYHLLKFTLQSGTTTLPISMKVRLHRIEPKIAVGPVMSTIAFTGVGHQTGTDVWADY